MIPSTMTGIHLVAHGGPECLVLRHDIPTPQPCAGEVLIKVHAAGVNNTDLNTRTAWYSKTVTEGTTGEEFDEITEEEATWGGAAITFPRIQGADVCGQVVAVGQDCDANHIGNRVLTCLQNFLLGSKFSEFHSGFRIYSVGALKDIPFDLNSDDFHFDTEIIIQLLFAGKKIGEIPIPTFYGEEVCHVNGMKYALDVIRASVRAKMQSFNLLQDKRFMKKCEVDQHQQKLEKLLEIAQVVSEAKRQKIQPARS